MTARSPSDMASALEAHADDQFDTWAIAEAHASSLAVSDDSLGVANASFPLAEWFSRPWLACVFRHEFDLTDAEALFVQEAILDDYQTSDATILHALTAQLRRHRQEGAAELALELLKRDAASPSVGAGYDLSGYLRCFAFVPLATIGEPERAAVTAFWDELPLHASWFVSALNEWLDLDDFGVGGSQVAVTIGRLLGLGAFGVRLAKAWFLSNDAKNSKPRDVIGALEYFVSTTPVLDDVAMRILMVLVTESSQPFGDLVSTARTLAATAR